MATHPQSPVDVLIDHLQSPPMTPTSRTRTFCPPQAHQTSPVYKRMGKFVQTPPLEFIEPTGYNHHFNFTRPQSCEPISHPSSDSERAYAATTRQGTESATESECDSDDENESDEESEQENKRPVRRVERAQFILEELDSDPGYDCDVEILRPDHCEDAKSDKSGAKAEVLARMNELQLEEDSSEDEERARIYLRKKKRWSAGIFKRSHSQSVEGDSSYSDNDPLDDIDQNARRLRRRVRGPRRESLIFEDRGFSNTNNIAEVEEPDEGIVLHSKGPPSIPSDDAFTLDELPFWRGHDDMDIEYESE
ncbi:hypothetical protein CFE70_000544 [Pyrenophora teres f. teres 0-1]|uniref:Uncharacterized protein n=2 Tax=Pyrenophora teres f. teres TaxID=97479 RepID=E3SAA7_PYRTT|nr:hypothetical protein PTT_20055 [Pyrenophora teres f. teres 0-1]KAE8836189.1 hypothetical protein HRS9139_04287 [Pyrenophora teres f. teres]KAE8837842.1 hypothetical protein PTNB85_05177 [Pyrenophora teres f. teres]KAE8839739.1 hypothetical protein HRS9122_06344 [Pyrenophora teres f. teres]KAE8862665.1 hypothetical protein PTNB29_05227 [Pyrenophora teres f. teres]